MAKSLDNLIGILLEKSMIDDIINLQKKYAIFNRSEMIRRIIDKGIDKIYDEGL